MAVIVTVITNDEWNCKFNDCDCDSNEGNCNYNCDYDDLMWLKL